MIGIVYKGGGDWYTFWGLSLSRLFWFLSEKGSALKGKKFAPVGSKFFPFRDDPFSKGIWCSRQQKRKLQKLSPLYKMAKIYQVYPVLNILTCLTLLTPNFDALRRLNSLCSFSAISYKEDHFVTSYLLSVHQPPSEKRYTLKIKA